MFYRLNKSFPCVALEATNNLVTVINLNASKMVENLQVGFIGLGAMGVGTFFHCAPSLNFLSCLLVEVAGGMSNVISYGMPMLWCVTGC